MPDPERKTPQVEPEADPAARLRHRADVQLSVMVPPHARDDLRRHAFEQNTTIRAIVLRALVATGVTALGEDDLVDRRL